MTLRINLSSLTVEENRYFFNGTLFSGVAIGCIECKVKKLVNISEGIYQKPYVGDILQFPSDQPMVDFSCLKEEEAGPDVPFLYNHARFSGVAFEFDGDFCVGEYLYEDGWEQDAVSYFKSGKLAAFDLMKGGFSQKVEFYEDSQLKTIYLFERDLFHSTFLLDKDGKVTFINIEGRYFEYVKNYQKKLHYSAFDKASFIAFECAEKIKLSGSGISDIQIQDLCEFAFKGTSMLWLKNSLVTVNGLKMLATVRGLQELNVRSEVITFEEVRTFKSQRPDCHVEFNGEAVTL